MINNLFLSVGAMKAGTTWLYEQLKDHPDIYFTPEKEIHYFANKIGIEKQLSHRNRIMKLKTVMEKYGKGNPKFISQNLDEIAWYANYAHPGEISNEWYESLFVQNPGKKFCADFSNLYCQMDEEGWDNVHAVCPNTKVIYTLRDPVKRLWSHYKFHHKWVGKEDNVIDDGIDVFKETLSKPWFIKNSEYAENFCKLKQRIPSENILVLYFEDFRKNPQWESNRITQFLGIEDIPIDEASGGEKVNPTKDFSLPVEWMRHVEEVLSPIEEKCKEAGLWHPDWTEVNKG